MDPAPHFRMHSFNNMFEPIPYRHQNLLKFTIVEARVSQQQCPLVPGQTKDRPCYVAERSSQMQPQMNLYICILEDQLQTWTHAQATL